MTTFLPRAAYALAAIAVALVAALLGWASPVAAHGTLVSSDPAEAAVLEALPSRAILTFSDDITEIVEITVTGPDGSVTNGDATSTGPEVRQTLWAGPDGSYEMGYHVVSSDGHEIRGEVAFEVGSSSGAGDEEATEPAVEPAEGEGGGGSGMVLLAGVVVVMAGAAVVLWRRRQVDHRS